ncbi:MotA/TolQ/ExbB proton channel family protein [Akkermansia sp.]|uniref:MotA/TolQ/ExbB proton channel family protein n=1 Tax=Akkermansia sp. TaxID=1872421 RepID=UPI00399538FA
MSELIIKIGPLFWVLSLLAVYGLAVVAERILYFHRIQINTGDFLRGISRLVNAGSVDEARHEASILPGPGARVVSSVLAHSGLERQELRTVAEDSVQMEVFQIEKNIRGLLVVATVSPLVGVLGTIQGLIGFYSQPGLLEGKAPTLAMSDAVFQALLSSALGLSIAIPAYLFYSIWLPAPVRFIPWNGPEQRPSAWYATPARGARTGNAWAAGKPEKV